MSQSSQVSQAIDGNLIFHYDLTNPSSYNQLTTTTSNNTIFDLSGNNNHSFIDDSSFVFYDSSEEALYFDGGIQRDGKGLFVQNVNYVSGDSDQIEELTIYAKVKAKSLTTNHPGDQRIILSFDRSVNFRFSIGSDINQISNSAAGKMVFHFSNSEGTHDIYDRTSSLDLRDDLWHELMIKFKANVAGGLSFYLDGI